MKNGIVFATLESTRRKQRGYNCKIRQMTTNIQTITPEFSVVITTCQRPTVLMNCLDALSRQQFQANQFEVIVVEDSYSADTERAVRLFADHTGIETRYLPQTGQPGLATIRNRGWRAARGRVIAFTNDNNIPQTDWLLAAARCYKRGAQVLSGQVRTTQTPQYNLARNRIITPVNNAEFTTDNCFCRRIDLERVAGFDEAFLAAWYGDNDLRFKFIGANIPILKCPEVVVIQDIKFQNLQSSLIAKRNSRHDALLYERHPDLFRQRVPPLRSVVFTYYVAAMSAVIGLVTLLIPNPTTAVTFLSIWLLITLDLFAQYFPKRVTWESLQRTAVRAVSTPILSIYWQIYGAVKHRVLHF
jgi:GT2 family glycosyltransferase